METKIKVTNSVVVFYLLYFRKKKELQIIHNLFLLVRLGCSSLTTKINYLYICKLYI